MTAFNPFDPCPTFVTMNGLRSPGLVSFEGLSNRRAWKITETAGTSGGTLKHEGSRLARFKIKFRLYTREDWDQWSVVKALLDREPKNLTDKSLGVAHPYLIDAGVTAIVVEEHTSPELTDPSGEYTVTVSCIQYTGEPVVAKSKVSGAPAPAAKAPQTESEQALAELQAKVEAKKKDAAEKEARVQSDYVKRIHQQQAQGTRGV